MTALATGTTARGPDPRQIPDEDLKAASLRYTTCEQPGIRRRRAGRSFRYFDAHARPVRDPATLQRIRSLAIPPAWMDVWITTFEDGHLQATGRDARGRRQYRYHPDWRRVRDSNKFDRVIEFGEALPRIRRSVNRALKARGHCRRKVLATVVRLLDDTLVRVGNAEYARENGSYGLTTLRAKHVGLRGATVRFLFRGKGGREHAVEIEDRQVARVIRRCLDIPGYELFQYLDDDGSRRTVSSGDVNDYLREISGDDFTAKDFRTWAATSAALRYLIGEGDPSGPAEARANVNAAIEEVAALLGNTAAVARRSYVHPAVLDAYSSGGLGRFHNGARAGDRLTLAVLRACTKHVPRGLSRSRKPQLAA
jgi:DNA topoisomerase-1